MCVCVCVCVCVCELQVIFTIGYVDYEKLLPNVII